MLSDGMAETGTGTATQPSTFDGAMGELGELLKDGVRHGHFRLEVHCDIVSGGTRRLIVVAGKSYQFMIRKDALP